MASISIASVAIPNWQLTSDVQLRIYALENFTAADGTLIDAGNPSEDASQNSNNYEMVACTLAGTTLTIAACTLESTTDSQNNPAAQYGAYFFTNEGQRIGAFGPFSVFTLPAAPVTTTWAAIEQAQEGSF